MCLGIPGQVVGMVDGYGDQLALVDVAGAQRKVNIGMLPEETARRALGADPHGLRGRDDRRGRRATQAMAGLELMGRGAELRGLAGPRPP